MKFELHAPFSPKGDQPKAIRQLVEGVRADLPAQTLLGVTGSGKTFTMAHVVEQISRPTLVLCHNKTLAAQLYGEFQQFFPKNAVEYFISYYDYYQPEAYIPSSGTYIEKDLAINDEIEKLRLRATTALLSGRKDVLVVSSVSCIYGLGNPKEFERQSITLKVGERISQRILLEKLVEMLYKRYTDTFSRGTFRVAGDVVDVFVAYGDFAYKIYFWEDEIERITSIDPETGQKLEEKESIHLFPANLFVADKAQLQQIIAEIQHDLLLQQKFFIKEGQHEEAARLWERTQHDLEMIRMLGYCSGVENYSRYFDKRAAGERPFCLLDYFPKDFLFFIDESHVTIPQVRGMWGGDRSRKMNLVRYGFRLPSALDNRPLTFNEFESLCPQVVFVSATPADYELHYSEGLVVEQIIRPTGLLDPEIFIRKQQNQMENILGEIHLRSSKSQRVLITTLTKRMAEELANFLSERNVKCCYMHSDVKALDRVALLRALRIGDYDVLVGVNLLREGLDLPEVSLVIVLDADKEGFLRNERSLIQTMGRAARNAEGAVILYADKITQSMQRAIDETKRRRDLQFNYNQTHDIVPQTIRKKVEEIIEQTKIADSRKATPLKSKQPAFTDPILASMSHKELQNIASNTYHQMMQAASKEDFLRAAALRNEWQMLTTWLEKKS